uniref:C2H2-type domain-containing protein n=1 Tax=Glossina brevipalpis TaxID=37001 RepID=A0A1A9WY53_9MUSC
MDDTTINSNFAKEHKQEREKNFMDNDNLSGDDISLTRQPLRTALTGFREAKNAFENGTEEVRRLLLQECSLIYECHVCRNLFRSLANFITHKRIYCRESLRTYYHSNPDHNSSVIIHTPNDKQRSDGWFVKSRSTGSSPLLTKSNAGNRDLSKIIERLKRTEINVPSDERPLTERKYSPASPVLQLEKVPTSAQAVYQTLKFQAADSIKTEVNEVNHLLSGDAAVLGPDGKAVNQFNLNNQSTEHIVTEEKIKLTCELCKITFLTEKTLKIHIQKKHTSSTYVFQCPSCSLTFLQPAAVIRHLANEHKKPLKRIRKMRDTILKKRVQIGDVHVKGPSRELKRLQMNEAKDLENDQANDQCLLLSRGKPVSICAFCKKTFERRAALSAHLLNCLAKKNSSNSGLSQPSNKRLKMMPLKVVQQQQQQHHCTFNNNNNNNDIQIKIEPLDQDQEEAEKIKDDEQMQIELNKMFENLGKQDFGKGLRTVSLDKLDILTKDDTDCPCPAEETKDINNSLDMSDIVDDLAALPPLSLNDAKAQETEQKKSKKLLTCRCKICNKQFNALSNLRRHISMFHYRARRFGCILCEYRAFRRYDIVNHLGFVHKMTGERDRMALEYVSVHEVNYSKDDVEGDILVVSEDMDIDKDQKLETVIKRKKRKKLIPLTELAHPEPPENGRLKGVKQKLRKGFRQQMDGNVKGMRKRPIRNRIKPENKDFVYDLSNLQEDARENQRSNLKRRNIFLSDHKSSLSLELTPPVKITPYRLRTEPLLPSDKSVIKGIVGRLYRRVVNNGLAAASTLPEIPTERPQMRPRLTSICRNDSVAVPIIETSELEAARLKSPFLDDSFLEKLAKRANTTFRLKPLLALQSHSPLKSLLQKFDTSLQISKNKGNQSTSNEAIENDFDRASLKSSSSTSESLPLQTLKQSPALNLEHPQNDQEIQIDTTPNGKFIAEPSSPPSTPKKRINLIQRLADRSKRHDNVLRAALEQ